MFLWKAKQAYNRAQLTGKPQYFGITLHGIPQACIFLAVGREAWRISQRAIEEFK
jgi:hypothetical protein